MTSIDLQAATTAFVTQARLSADWLDGQDLSRPSSLPAWTRAQLLTHLCRAGEALVQLAPQAAPQAPLSVAQYVSHYAGAAREIAERVQGEHLTDLRAVADHVEHALAGAVEHTVPGPRGPIRLSDLVATRVLELVVHSLDLGHEAPLDQRALGIVVRLLVDVIAERHPGRAVELRVPPFAAVQLLEGATHRRGTPPAVVETDPVTWVLLATGRLSWAQARVSASGERSDLSGLLPLLA